MSGVCRNCGGSGKERCWNCDGEGGTWREIAGEREWEKCPLCWGDGANNCVNCNGTGRV
ncbi:MAG: hypothetical protein AB9861_00745 [Methanosarcina sp.]